MARVDVMVVEDETIVAKDIQRQLTRFGYGIAAVASSGEEAVEKVAQTHPDLVLMDIRLKGKLDGVKATQAIRKQTDIPVVYLTAYADDHTLERARATEPSGYLIKPFEGRQLQMAIEIAVQKHRSRRAFRERLFTTLGCIGDGLILTDRRGCVTLLNPLAEDLTGRTSAGAIGKPITEVFRIIDRHSRSVSLGVVTAALQGDDRGALESRTARLLAEDGTEAWIEYSAVPLRDEGGSMLGVIVFFRDDTKHKRAIEKLLKDRGSLRALLKDHKGELSGTQRLLKGAITQRARLQRALHNKHIVLKEILRHIELEKQEVHDRVLASVDDLVIPIVRKLKLKGSSCEPAHLDLLERKLKELTTPSAKTMKRELSMLSSREIEICDLIKGGLTSKEVGRLLNITPSTVERHRNNIRRKIGIQHQKVNITTFLQGL